MQIGRIGSRPLSPSSQAPFVVLGLFRLACGGAFLTPVAGDGETGAGKSGGAAVIVVSRPPALLAVFDLAADA